MAFKKQGQLVAGIDLTVGAGPGVEESLQKMLQFEGQLGAIGGDGDGAHAGFAVVRISRGKLDELFQRPAGVVDFTEARRRLERLAGLGEETSGLLGVPQALGQPSSIRPLPKSRIGIHGCVEFAGAFQVAGGFHRGGLVRSRGLLPPVPQQLDSPRGIGLHPRGVDEIPRFLQQRHRPAPLSGGQEQLHRCSDVAATREADGSLDRDSPMVRVEVSAFAPVVIDTAQERLSRFNEAAY